LISLKLVHVGRLQISVNDGYIRPESGQSKGVTSPEATRTARDQSHFACQFFFTHTLFSFFNMIRTNLSLISDRNSLANYKTSTVLEWAWGSLFKTEEARTQAGELQQIKAGGGLLRVVA